MAWNPLDQLGLKAASLALGALFWLVVSGHQIERRVAVPVSYSNVPVPLQMTGDQVDDVSVHIRGSDNRVTSLEPGQLRVVVDLTDAHSGTNLIPLRTDEVTAPPGIEVMQLDPGTVTVTLEKSGTIQAPVLPLIEGQPAPGYVVVGSATIEPKTATIEGPESRLERPVDVITERVSLEGRTSTLVQDVRIGVADAQLRVKEPRTVRVTIRVEPAKTPPAPSR